jgi:hemerythrin-like domain-containing protein
LQQIPAPGSQSAVLDPGWTLPGDVPRFVAQHGQSGPRGPDSPRERSAKVEATKLLKKQHDEVKDLFKQFEAAEEDSERQELFDQIADDFAAHGEIEEKIFYPAVYVGKLKDKLQEAVEEHLVAKRVVADLLEMEPSDEQFDAKMTVLKELIEHHVEEEEGELFPLVRQNFAREELDALGEQMEKTFAQLQEDEPREKIPSEIDHAPPLG